MANNDGELADFDALDQALIDFDFQLTADTSALATDFTVTDTNLYLPFAQALMLLLEQPYLAEIEFYPIGTATMVALAWDSMLQALMLVAGMLLIMLFLLWRLFCSASAIVWSMLTIISSLIWLLGLSALFAAALSQLIALSVMLIISVGIADCVHVMSSYLFYIRQGKQHQQAIYLAYYKNGLPILLTSITTMTGILALILIDIPTFSLFAITSAAGVLLAFLFTVCILPLLLEYWHPKVANSAVKANSQLFQQPSKQLSKQSCKKTLNKSSEQLCHTSSDQPSISFSLWRPLTPYPTI